MIVLKMPAERGGRIEFADVPAAVVRVQDELAKWRKLLHAARVESNADTPLSGIAATWERVATDLDRIRSAVRRGQSPENYMADFSGLIINESLVGRALSFTALQVGSSAADAAAISLDIGEGEINWADNVAVAGLTAFKMYYEKLSHEAFSVADYYADNVRAKVIDLAKKFEALQSDSQGISKLIESEVSKSDALIDSHQVEVVARINELGAVSSDQIRAMNEKIANIGQELQALSGLKEAAVSEHDSAISEAIADGKQRVVDWVNAQMEQTRLEAPARLWETRSENHLREARSLRAWCLGLGVGGLALSAAMAVGAFKLAEWIFQGVVEPARIVASGDEIASAASAIRLTFQYELIFSAATMLLWLTLFLWTMRIVVRRYSTENHLAIDASSRSAMTQTYLGLIKEGAASDAERAIVLSAIFSPVGEKAAKDDTPPGISLPALAAAMVGGKASN